MGKLKGAHVSKKEQHTAYKNQSRYTKNKRAALERHLKKHPNDEVASKALGAVSESTIRKTPNAYVWKSQQRKYAQQLASLGYNGHIALGGKEEAKRQDQVIGFGAKQVLDIPEKQRASEVSQQRPSQNNRKKK